MQIMSSSVQGPITAALLRPDLSVGGLFRADFLVVTAAGYPTNTLRGVQRQRWSPGLIAGTLDIGCDNEPDQSRPCETYSKGMCHTAVSGSQLPAVGSLCYSALSWWGHSTQCTAPDSRLWL